MIKQKNEEIYVVDGEGKLVKNYYVNDKNVKMEEVVYQFDIDKLLSIISEFYGLETIEHIKSNNLDSVYNIFENDRKELR